MAPLLFLGVAAICGVFAADQLFAWPFSIFQVSAIVVGALAFIFLDRRNWCAGLMFLTTLFGFAAIHKSKIESIHEFFLIPNLQRGESIRVANAVASVIKEPMIVGTGAQNSGRAVIQIDQFDLAGKSWPCKKQIPVFFESLPSDLQYGDKIKVSGLFQPLLSATSPGAFDEKQFHFRTNDAIAKFRVQAGDSIQILERDSENPIISAAIHSRKWLESALSYGIEDAPIEIRSVTTAMVLGTREDSPEEIEDLFRLSGTMHIFAVSGLHVGIIAGICLFILPLLGVSRRTASLIMIPAILFYAFITGLRPSAIRAAIMVCVVASAFCLRRNPRILNSLGCAALIILALNTQEVFQIGFQLSFAVLLAIVVFAEPISRWFYRPFELEPLMPRRLIPRLRIWIDTFTKKFCEGLGVSIAAWVGSLLLIGWYFKIITLTGVLANLVMIPIATFIIGIAASSSIFFAFKATWITAILNKANIILSTALVKLAFYFSTIPGGYLSTPNLNPAAFSEPYVHEFSVEVLANDGASAQLISIPGLENTNSKTPQRQWLIDTGDPFLFRGKVQPLLRSHGINQLEGVFLTHGDQNHIGALPIVIDRFRPRSTFETHLTNRARIYKEIRTAADLLKIPNFQLVKGDQLELGPDTKVEILFPPRNFPDQPRADDHCLIVRLHHHRWRILFTADAGFTAEKWLLENHADLKSDIWIKGRHGSSPSGLIQFLDEIEPDVVIATNAGFPVFEKIPDEWIKALRDRKIDLFDLSNAGSVSINGDKKQLRVKSFLEPDHSAIVTE